MLIERFGGYIVNDLEGIIICSRVHVPFQGPSLIDPQSCLAETTTPEAMRSSSQLGNSSIWQ
jgi:hypothetical protein